jgi:cytochrome b561
MAATQGYKPFARALHWFIALWIIATLPIGGLMTEEGISRALSNTLYILHKNGGVILILLMLVRLGYRLMNPPPPLPASLPEWQVRAAGATHVALYVMVFFMAVTGYIRVRAGGFPVEMLDAMGLPPLVPRSDALENAAQTAHSIGRFVLLAFLAAHIGAALQHKFIKKDGVFDRMWPIAPR